MSNFKNNLKVGQPAKFFRTHDKQTPLTGTIVRIWPGDEDLVDIKTEPGNGSVGRIEIAHASDVTVLAQAEGAQQTNAPAAGTRKPIAFK